MVPEGVHRVSDGVERSQAGVRDEHDDATPDVVPAGQGWRVSGLLRIDEVALETGFRAAEGEYETIGGLALEKLGHIPEAGESIELTAFDRGGPLDNPVRWRATVVQRDGRRIDLLDLRELGPGGEA